MKPDPNLWSIDKRSDNCLESVVLPTPEAPPIIIMGLSFMMTMVLQIMMNILNQFQPCC